ncbi:MAG TPA: adenylate/guanylate cyclase domain-containing protein [Chitinophagaceae bacterium]|nr:adenylate/guanylate cyclase domain-containing protein [Chitinophagaceae bacterium]
MKLKPALLYKIRQVIAITVLWIIAGILLELNNAVNYDPVNREYFFYFIFGNNLFGHLLITAAGPLVGGFLGGSFIVFYQRGRLKGKTYKQKLLIHSSIYILFVGICILLVGIIGALIDPDKPSFFQRFYADIFSLRVLRLMINWYIIVLLTMFLLDVSEKYGSGILRKLLLGGYYSPGKEERIFMFLDLKASTSIAEKIGDEVYFRMLRYFYQLANEVIINNHGEIYQYVGDEIVISWEKEQGLNNANCLQCFKAIRETVKEKADFFMENFGVIPSFKAAIHSGIVTAGLIGSVKKDIVFSGDVLNTTARMVALCNQYQQTLIISEYLYKELKDTPGYQFNYLDSPVLRGKTVKTGLYGVWAIEVSPSL